MKNLQIYKVGIFCVLVLIKLAILVFEGMYVAPDFHDATNSMVKIHVPAMNETTYRRLVEALWEPAGGFGEAGHGEGMARQARLWRDLNETCVWPRRAFDVHFDAFYYANGSRVEALDARNSPTLAERILTTGLDSGVAEWMREMTSDERVYRRLMCSRSRRLTWPRPQGDSEPAVSDKPAPPELCELWVRVHGSRKRMLISVLLFSDGIIFFSFLAAAVARILRMRNTEDGLDYSMSFYITQRPPCSGIPGYRSVELWSRMPPTATFIQVDMLLACFHCVLNLAYTLYLPHRVEVPLAAINTHLLDLGVSARLLNRGVTLAYSVYLLIPISVVVDVILVAPLAIYEFFVFKQLAAEHREQRKIQAAAAAAAVIASCEFMNDENTVLDLSQEMLGLDPNVLARYVRYDPMLDQYVQVPPPAYCRIPARGEALPPYEA
ncbi:uncharacterized protein SAPINGB_P006403 [Magnusiomyces paraingens]|uniref:Uncharacterized protein n=1 Tax=Magnusiomyces paraingens TaxID=2606893 RepID=A0A5E8C7H4_9ASCO|nr:uncharacterized protein SAPINGB_P006403 [Saprochaete ingens]VVT58825.1 unnamed protein product [Saprochaete ingens]